MRAGRRTVFSLLVMLIGLLPLVAHAVPRALRPGDVEKFIRTFPAMYEEYHALGITVNPQTGQVTGMAKARASDELNAILKRHGWNRQYWGKLRAVMNGYAVLTHEEAKRDARPQINEAVRKIEQSKYVKPEAKAKLRQDVKKGQSDFDRAAGKWRANVHDKDIEQIRPHLPAMREMFRSAQLKR